MTTSALIGHTGFVGGNLARQHAFDDVYHSQTIETLAGRSYDLIVCAGAPGVKWKANQDPDTDHAAIDRLMRSLSRATAKRVILISTIDVYPAPSGVDEDDVPDAARAGAYGRHRFELEQFVSRTFPSLVVRLPGLFGPGLKKNIIFDFLHGNDVHKIHADAQFQFYGLDSLWADLDTARRHGLTLLNVGTEPVSVAEVARAGFGLTFDNRPAGVAPARYDMTSRHAALFGGRNGYLQDRARVLDDIRRFVEAQRS